MNTLSSSSSTTTSSSSSYMLSGRKYPHPKRDSRASNTSRLTKHQSSYNNASPKSSDSSGSLSSSYMESPSRSKSTYLFSNCNDSPKRIESFPCDYSHGRKKPTLPAFISTIRPSSSSSTSSLASSSTSTSYLASPTLKRSQSCSNSAQASTNTSTPSSRHAGVIKQNNSSTRREYDEKYSKHISYRWLSCE